MQKDVIEISGKTSKSKRTRQLPLHPLLKAQLKEYFVERKQKGYKTEYLFVSNNRDAGLSVDGMKHWVKRLNTLTGIEFHLHQFRHAFACGLAKNGTSMCDIQKLMGHKDLRMTDRYLRSRGVEELRDDVYKLRIDNLW
ncbi:tyrosine-type recombinase/integrase [Candidatus Uhrbacteria bacterium]|nr:tyrosine-type recombinase/integrase [Candidatus Uhrbacteria bacterium]